MDIIKQKKLLWFLQAATTALESTEGGQIGSGFSAGGEGRPPTSAAPGREAPCPRWLWLQEITAVVPSLAGGHSELLSTC